MKLYRCTTICASFFSTWLISTNNNGENYNTKRCHFDSTIARQDKFQSTDQSKADLSVTGKFFEAPFPWKFRTSHFFSQLTMAIINFIWLHSSYILHAILWCPFLKNVLLFYFSLFFCLFFVHVYPFSLKPNPSLYFLGIRPNSNGQILLIQKRNQKHF